MRYCTSCKRVELNEEITDCDCVTYRKNKLKSFESKSEFKCKRCDSTEDLFYNEPWESSFGNTIFDDDFTCKVCKDRARAEYERQEAMNYVIIDNGGDIIYCEDSNAVEEELESLLEDVYDEGESSLIVLKIEKIERDIKAEDFKHRKNNILIYDDERYLIEEANSVSLEFEGDKRINWG